MRFLLICIMLHCISFSQIPLIQLTKQRQTEHSKSVSASETLWDNQVRYLGSGITSAQLNGLPQFQRSIEVVDDFTIPSGFNWSIDSIFAIGTPAGGNPDRFRVIIYSDNTGDVGPVIYAEEFEATTSVIIRHRLQTPLNLSSGDYWFSIVAVFDDADDFTVKNWFWDTSPDERRFEARVRDFTGQSGFNIWTPFSQAGVADHSVSFALYGTDLTPPFFKDSITLVELYSQLDGPNWLNQSGWQSADSLGQWFGVKTENGRLVELDLSDNNLSGTINLRLDFLSVLKKLNLSGNNLTGVLDGDRFMLDSLTHLDLSANQFSGQIPDDFFSLPKLEYLNLSKNQFNGFLDYLGDSSSTLNYLNLADNQLSYIPVLDFHIDSLILNNNRFVFNSIEINLDHSTYMNYADQDSLGEEIDTIVQKGGGFSVLIQDNAESNIYTWYLNDIEISSSISNFFQADNLDFNDSGTYRYEITNTVADQLVIHSRPIHIEIKDLNTTLFLFQSPGFSQKFKAVLRSDTPLENVPLIKLNNFVLSTI
ncbi:MAG: hypothetical protein KDD94_13335, partial [Calditrichaeota bacterium]|nr:hypothetical protein [Calditrichota bacterium]